MGNRLYIRLEKVEQLSSDGMNTCNTTYRIIIWDNYMEKTEIVCADDLTIILDMIKEKNELLYFIGKKFQNEFRLSDKFFSHIYFIDKFIDVDDFLEDIKIACNKREGK